MRKPKEDQAQIDLNWVLNKRNIGSKHKDCLQKYIALYIDWRISAIYLKAQCVRTKKMKHIFRKCGWSVVKCTTCILTAECMLLTGARLSTGAILLIPFPCKTDASQASYIFEKQILNILWLAKTIYRETDPNAMVYSTGTITWFYVVASRFYTKVVLPVTTSIATRAISMSSKLTTICKDYFRIMARLIHGFLCHLL